HTKVYSPRLAPLVSPGAVVDRASSALVVSSHDSGHPPGNVRSPPGSGKDRESRSSEFISGLACAKEQVSSQDPGNPFESSKGTSGEEFAVGSILSRGCRRRKIGVKTKKERLRVRRNKERNPALHSTAQHSMLGTL